MPTFGERVKQARTLRGYTQQELGKQAGVTFQAISKYERDQDMPGSDVLLRLARALDVRSEYFFRPRAVSIVSPVYRNEHPLAPMEEQRVAAHLQDWLERYVQAEDLTLLDDVAPSLPVPVSVSTMEDVETAAEALREYWHLGRGAIESVTDALEDRGIKVGLAPGGDAFDALLFKADGLPVIATNENRPGDRRRFNLCHELGHMVLAPGDDMDAEAMAHRFAAAFLVPAEAARFELGPRRTDLSLTELHLLKQKYGLSMQAWIKRARELEILPVRTADRWLREFKRRGWRVIEPGDPFPSERETPKRMERLVYAALAEDRLSPGRAAELLGQSLAEFWDAPKTRLWLSMETRDDAPEPRMCTRRECPD